MKQLKPLGSMIFTIRDGKVIIDADLATLYAVPTKALNQAVKRDADRFPLDFAFRLTAKEQLEVVTNCDHLARLKFSRTLPHLPMHPRDESVSSQKEIVMLGDMANFRNSPIIGCPIPSY